MATGELVRGTPWLPGQSGNPSGPQPEQLRRIRTLARHSSQYGIEVVDRMMAMMRGEDPSVTGMAKVRAGEVVLDRAYGKPSDGLALAIAEEATSASVELGVRFVMGSRRVEFTEEAALPVIEQPPAEPAAPPQVG